MSLPTALERATAPGKRTATHLLAHHDLGAGGVVQEPFLSLLLPTPVILSKGPKYLRR